jgi:DNA-binding Xre family transcriptional regulator
MSQITGLVAVLKQVLRTNGWTYAKLAQALDMSEANIKRLFASERFTLERLEQVCGLLELELSDLFLLYEQSRQRITRLTEAQERQLVADMRLLLVAVCVRNHLTFEDIIASYLLAPTECIRHLARLDKLGIIDLLPGNRIKLRIDENFHWIPGGPIEMFFTRQVQPDFLDASFSGEGDHRHFVYGLLSEASREVMARKLQMLAQELVALHRQDAALPLSKKHSTGLLLAMRQLEITAFQTLRKS